MSEIARDTATTVVRPRRRLTWLVAPPLVVGLAAAAFLVGPGRSSHPVPAGPAAAPSASVSPAELLHRAAQAAAARPALAVKDNQFIFDRSVGSGGDSGSGAERRMWVAADGRSNGMIEDPAQFGTVDNPSGRIGYSQGSPGPGEPPAPSVLFPTYAYLATLPTDPQQLLQRLYQEGNGKQSAPGLAAFRDAERLFSDELLTPPVAGAMMEAIAQAPGVTVLADEVDAAGRHGVALRAVDGPNQISLIFDRNTGQFLGERWVLIQDLPPLMSNGKPVTTAPNGKPINPGSRKAGAVSGSAVLQVAVTDHAGDEPKS